MVSIPAFSLTEGKKIQVLLNRIEKSQSVFIRNGKEYSSIQAREHLEYKLSRAGSRIKTAMDFIEHVAGRPYLTGISYYIKYPDGEKIKTGDWLKNQLDQIEKQIE